ncbi:proline-rich receptor-like protein kinase PERK5 [Olea europaea var. sylvestris]|uniref:proline-rich receptor-like protein kinase PERK5 n=1 Tax=Olea europaea var. sylvestris TaxID=158386 RepID=UPI000C1CE034|nr:proline-rich receptor-like protein kinase PERK5 [Olea europaea var. sylvestris]
MALPPEAATPRVFNKDSPLPPPPPSTDSSPAPDSSSPPPTDASPPPSDDSPPPPPPPTTKESSSKPTPSTPEKPKSPPQKGSPSPPISSPTTPAPRGSPPTNALSPPSHHSPSHKSPDSSASGGGGGGSSPSPSSDSSSSSVPIIVGIIVGGVLIFALFAICLACSKKKKKRTYYPAHPGKGGDKYYNGNSDHIVKFPPPQGVMGTPVGGAGGWGAPPPPGNTSSEFSSGQHHIPLASPSPNMGMGGFSQSQFTYDELATATGGFSQANLLGQGGFGYVHKGILPNGREVAVKSLKSGSGQGEREFQAEVEIISRVHHRHLVSLVGYCIADGQRMLVYEFVPNSTLEHHLHGNGQPVMDWVTRLRIAVGSAKGLAYLHEDCHPRIIHRDIKAANILLDNNYEAMVADFGLAKLTSDNFTHVSTRVMGTFGYLAPEYASSGKLSEKSDVFSFGVMLLELITGQRPVDLTNRTMEDSLVDWARPLMAQALEDGNYNKLVEPRLEGNFVPQEMARMVACAAASIRHSARRRPRMSQIVRALEGDSSLDDLSEGGKSLVQSAAHNHGGNNIDVYDTRAYNADMTKFRKMVISNPDNASSEYGATSEYGLNPSSSSSDSRELDDSVLHKPKP